MVSFADEVPKNNDVDVSSSEKIEYGKLHNIHEFKSYKKFNKLTLGDIERMVETGIKPTESSEEEEVNNCVTKVNKVLTSETC